MGTCLKHVILSRLKWEKKDVRYFLKGKNILKASRDYYAVYEQIGGLEINSKVFMNGYRIGQVDEIYFNDDGSGDLTIIMGVHKLHRIPVGSISEIFSSDLLGTKAVQIVLAVII